MSQPTFSICIPNYNYANYLGETLDSVLAQTRQDFEILIADNASTDSSVKVIQDYRLRDTRIQLKTNRCNVGFGGNLSKSASMANGRWMTMLSSDDLIMPEALSVYGKLIDALGEDAEDTILSSTVNIIDGKSEPRDIFNVDWKLWACATKNEKLSALVGANVWMADAKSILQRSLNILRTPFYFCTTTYSKKLHDSVEGYSQGGLYNPDKRFAWSILAKAKYALIVEKPIFSYRIHSNNQDGQQKKQGALRHLVDEYTSTFTVPDDILDFACISREDFSKFFVENDIALRGLKSLSDGDRIMARRVFNLGMAAYPEIMKKNKKIMILRMLLAVGFVGVLAAKKARVTAEKKWKEKIIST